MNITPMEITDLMLIEPEVFSDDRGFFYESFNQLKFEINIGQAVTFVQDNHSYSHKGVVRGLHYQLPPKAQAKLVRVVVGEVFDVAVDIRKASPTFGKWIKTILSSKNRKQIWIPEGFAHGFLVLSEKAELLYKTTDYYSNKHERCIRWNDPIININWPAVNQITVSQKDKDGLILSKAELF